MWTSAPVAWRLLSRCAPSSTAARRWTTDRWTGRARTRSWRTRCGASPTGASTGRTRACCGASCPSPGAVAAAGRALIRQGIAEHRAEQLAAGSRKPATPCPHRRIGGAETGQTMCGQLHLPTDGKPGTLSTRPPRWPIIVPNPLGTAATLTVGPPCGHHHFLFGKRCGRTVQGARQILGE